MKKAILIERVRQLGFSEYEVKCYLALLERESLGVSEVSKVAGIPRSNAYEAMEKLARKGLCSSIPGKTRRYTASDPLMIKEKSLSLFKETREIELALIEKKRREIIEQRDKELAELEHKEKNLAEKEKELLSSIDNLIDELGILFRGGRENSSPLDYIEIVKDPLQAHHRVMKLLAEANHEILAFLKPPYSYALIRETSSAYDGLTQIPGWEAQRDGSYRARERGVTIRSIQELPADEKERMQTIENLGIAKLSPESKMRVADSLPIKAMVFDEKIVLYSMEDPLIGKLSLTTLITENRALAKSFKMLFDSVWEKAMDYVIIDNQKVLLSELSDFLKLK